MDGPRGTVPAPPGRSPEGRPSSVPRPGRQVAAVRRFRLTVAGSALFAVVLAGWLLSGAGGVVVRADVQGALMTAVPLLAAVFCGYTAWRLRGRQRRGWSVLSAACLAFAAGGSVLLYYALLQRPVPIPGPADPPFLAAPCLAVAAMLMLAPRSTGLSSRLRAVVDAGILAASLLFLSWMWVIGPMARAIDAPGTRLVSLAYPTADVVLMTAAVLFSLRTRPGERRAALLVAAGALVYAMADTGFAFAVVNDQYRPGTLIDGGWICGYLLIGMAAAAALAWPQSDPDATDTPNGYLGELLPYVPAVVALAVHFGLRLDGSKHEDLSEVVRIVLVAGIVALVLVRQALTIVGDVRLTRNLDRQVRLRTGDLARLSRQHGSILNSAGDGIYGVGADGRVTFINAAGARLLGRPSSEVTGCHHHEFLRNGPAEATDDVPVGLQVSSSLEPLVAQGRFRRADGTLAEAEYTATPLEDDDGQGGFVVLFRDITQRRAVERMKDEFVSVVSHELRTPLTSIRGALGLLAGGAFEPLSEKGQRMADVALESSERLVRLINDILDVERMAAGRLDLHREPCSVTTLVETALAEMRPMANQAGVRLVGEAARGRVWADADRVTQALTNLLSNAVKFSPAGSEVTVAASVRDGAVQFEVRDRGRGIPPEHLDSVFGRFQQVDSSDARHGSGTGLGLAICRGIVEQHGGRIWVTSTVGEGSTFTFTLPSASPEPSPAGAADPEGSTPSSGTVLVCDDDAGVVDVLVALFEAHGHHTLPAYGGEQAIELAVRHQPAVVVLDLLMPGMSGWETAAALKSRPETAHIPIVILSVLGPDETEVREADGWVSKPAEPAALLAALGHALGERSAPRVLVVEDDEQLGQVMMEVFATRDVECALAVTGREAVRLSRLAPPDLLVLDLTLPDGDGFAVVDALRRDDRLRSVPVVVYTAVELEESDRRRLRLGETTFLTKGRTPPAEFERRVLQLLDSIVPEGRAARRAAAAAGRER